MNAVDDDEVEQLLRAAQDDALLKLNINSHIARATSSSSDSIHPDLDRRFQALKKAPAPNTKHPPKIDSSPPKNGRSEEKKTTEGSDGVDDVAGEDDLFARFMKLKKSLPAYSSDGPSEYKGDFGNYVAEEENSDEDEVGKLIKWAVDAARLDPSPPSDHDNDDHSAQSDDDDGDEEEETDDDDGKKRRRK